MEKQDYIRQELDRATREWAMRAALLGAALFLALSALDFAFVPERSWRFLCYRIVAAGGLAAVAALLKRSQRPRRVNLLVLAGTLVGAVALEAMILDFGGHHSPYFIGMILLAVMALGLIPLGAGFASLVAGAIFAVYVLPILALDRLVEHQYFTVEAVLFLCILAGCVLNRRLTWEHFVGEVSLRHELLTHQAQLEAEVAQRQATERELREENEQRRRGEDRLRLFATAVEGAAEGISILDPGGRIIYFNPAGAAQTGVPAGELSGRDIRELLAHPEVVDEVIQPALLKSGRWAGEVVGSPRGSRPRPLWLAVSLIRGEGGAPVAMLGISKDLTAQRQLEDHHIKTQKLESVGVLAGGLAHDFNNLLTIILGNIDLARLFAGENADVAEALDHAAEASLRAGDLTRQLITFSKGGQPVKRVADIKRLVQETVSFAASGSNIICELTIPDGLPLVEFDEGQMRQVVHNLVQNAREAMPAGGTVAVRGQEVFLLAQEIPPLPAGRYVRFDFMDRGTGIDPENLHQIFDPYFSTKEMSTAKGRGLGLAVTYSIIRSHGGAITVDSSPGAGTTFSLFLPASEEGAEEDEEAPRPKAERPAAAHAPAERHAADDESQPSRGRVLVMDDEELVLEMAGAALRKMGYRVELCRAGAETIVRYQIALDAGKPFDAVILDLTIPGGMGGLETIRRLRDIDPRVSAAISSGYTNDPIATEYRAVGFKAFIAKPYSIKALEELLEGLR
jgi:PAS domain S-box-containing protein